MCGIHILGSCVCNERTEKNTEFLLGFHAQAMRIKIGFIIISLWIYYVKQFWLRWRWRWRYTAIFNPNHMQRSMVEREMSVQRFTIPMCMIFWACEGRSCYQFLALWMEFHLKLILIVLKMVFSLFHQNYAHKIDWFFSHKTNGFPEKKLVF